MWQRNSRPGSQRKRTGTHILDAQKMNWTGMWVWVLGQFIHFSVTSCATTRLMRKSKRLRDVGQPGCTRSESSKMLLFSYPFPHPMTAVTFYGWSVIGRERERTAVSVTRTLSLILGPHERLTCFPTEYKNAAQRIDFVRSHLFFPLEVTLGQSKSLSFTSFSESLAQK